MERWAAAGPAGEGEGYLKIRGFVEGGGGGGGKKKMPLRRGFWREDIHKSKKKETGKISSGSA